MSDTFDTWNDVLDRLSRLFREGLNSADADERATHSQLFGNSPLGLTTRILDFEVGRLVSGAIAMRNKKEAHDGILFARQRGQYHQGWADSDRAYAARWPGDDLSPLIYADPIAGTAAIDWTAFTAGNCPAQAEHRRFGMWAPTPTRPTGVPLAGGNIAVG